MDQFTGQFLNPERLKWITLYLLVTLAILLFLLNLLSPAAATSGSLTPTPGPSHKHQIKQTPIVIPTGKSDVSPTPVLTITPGSSLTPGPTVTPGSVVTPNPSPRINPSPTSNPGKIH